jgi:heme/copper-type cytochrome/quinol oxidase subunit 2
MKKVLLLCLLLIVLGCSMMGLVTNLWLSATPLSPERYEEVKHAVYLLGLIAVVSLIGVIWTVVLLLRSRRKKRRMRTT